MTTEFHRLLDRMILSCFEWKRTRRKSSDKPWISDDVRKRIKQRAAVFRETGRSKKWKRLDRAIKRTISYRKTRYNVIQKTRLEQSGSTGQWWSIAKFLRSDENPRPWTVTDWSPDKPPIDLANELAEHFSSITNEKTALVDSDIPTSNVGDGLVRLVTEGQVANRLKKIKKAYQ